MQISQRISVPALVQWCRALHHGLDVGLSPGKILRQQSKSGPAEFRELAGRIAGRLDGGDSFEEALAPDRHKFPFLFLEMVALGEQTGRLTDTFDELCRHFEAVQSSRRQFFTALTWPVIMYIGAILVIAALIFILGILPPGLDGKPPFRPFGDILIGPTGALIWLIGATLFTVGVAFAYFVTRDNESLRSKLEAKALIVPGLGGCFRDFALHRFAMALHMSSEAGLGADRALLLAFRATTNEAYQKHADSTAKQVRAGKEIAPALAACGTRLFPEEFVDTVQVGEESGQLAEVMEKQARHYGEEATRKLRVVTLFAALAVYGMVGLMIIVMIVKLVMAIGGVYEDAARGL